MASCNPFSVEFSGSAQQFFENISRLVKKQRGSITGDATGGKFTVSAPFVGSFHVEFTISGQTSTMHVKDIPFHIPCGMLESAMRKRIGKFKI